VRFTTAADAKTYLCEANCAAIPTGLLESELFGHERARSPEPLRKNRAIDLADRARSS